MEVPIQCLDTNIVSIRHFLTLHSDHSTFLGTRFRPRCPQVLLDDSGDRKRIRPANLELHVEAPEEAEAEEAEEAFLAASRAFEAEEAEKEGLEGAEEGGFEGAEEAEEVGFEGHEEAEEGGHERGPELVAPEARPDSLHPPWE